MTSDQAHAQQVEELVASVLDRAPEERAGFFEAACAGNEALRAEVLSLLRYDDLAPEFLETPPYASLQEALDGGAPGELRAGDVLGDCRILQFLSEGSMGEVYLAEDTRLERRVAVKLLRRSLDAETLQRRFRHERKVLASLNHPNIARLYGGATTPDGRAFLVLEYVEGERLDDFCRQRQLSLPARLSLFRKVCAAVTYAHQNLVIHRDLKPANIRVTADGEPKLLDFGIAKLLDPDGSRQSDATVTMFPAMTPGYASPEQLRNEPITTASDVYSLGVILFELLTGQRPHARGNLRGNELARVVCEEEPLRPSTVAARTTGPEHGHGQRGEESPAKLRRRLEGDLDNIAAMALRKEPGRRYASVAQLSEDIRRHGEGLPVMARKDTLGYRAGKFVGRHKTAVAGAVLLLLALFGGLWATQRQARIAQRERDQARQALASAQQARRQSERLNQILEDLLGSADPGQMGKDVKVVDVLDKAGANLDRDLRNEPEILAEAHDTLRRAYAHLGLLEPAEQHARAALEIVRRLHGGEAPPTARAEQRLADVLGDRNHFEDAEPLLRHALAIERRAGPPDDFELANTLGSLSFALASSGRTREAEPLVAEALSRMRRARGENSLDYVGVLSEWGNLKVYLRDYQTGADTFRRVVALDDQLLPGSPREFGPLINLGICLFDLRQLAEMKPVVERLEENTRRLVGENSLYYAMARFLHAGLDFAQADYATAIPLLRQALPMFVGVYPPGQTTVVQCRALLGVCLTRAGQAPAGEPFLRIALENGRKVDKNDFVHTVSNLETALGECLLAQGRFAEAEPLLLTGYGDLQKLVGEHDPMSVAAAARLHELYVAWNKPAEAARFAVAETPPATPAP